ncbi:MAG: TolB family protein [Luteitalea sp.]
MFQSDLAGRPKIFSVDVATGEVRALTTGAEWRDESPRWSPDGQHIAFTSNRAHYGASPEAGTPDLDVYVMRADGSEIRRVTTDPGNEHDPSWLPNGHELVVSSDRDSRGDLFRVRLADGQMDRLTHNFVGRAIMPAASPDGTRVAFAAQTLRVGEFWNFQVHVLDLASGRTEPVPASGGACWPSWSRDGRSLLLVQLDREPSALQRRDLASGQVQTVHADPRLWSYYPRTSPDGRWVALSVSPEHHDGENWDLALVSAEAPHTLVRLTAGPGNDRLADWRP